MQELYYFLFCEMTIKILNSQLRAFKKKMDWVKLLTFLSFNIDCKVVYLCTVLFTILKCYVQIDEKFE